VASAQNPINTRTAYEQVGDGSAVVLIHGLGLCRQMWQWQAPVLSEHFHVIRYDLIGHGESDKPAGPYAMADFVAQLREVVDSVGIDEFALVGFSLGGLIAQAFTLAHPDRVRAVGILHSAYDRSADERAAVRKRVLLADEQGPKAGVDAALERWFTPEFAARCPERLQQIREWLEANDPDAFAAAYRVLAESDAELAPALSDIRCPALVMTGSEDHGNSPQMAARMAARMPNAECRVLPELRHMALAEDPQSTLSQLLPFLANALTPGP
jgi:pimeloyl-ACP methyl ester carboxylesterase